MSRNPYTPPDAPVGDIALGHPQPSRPAAITVAVCLLSLQYALAFVSMLQHAGDANGGGLALVLGTLVGLALGAWFTHSVWCRRGWARIALTAIVSVKLAIGAFWWWWKILGLPFAHNALYLVGLALLVGGVALQYTPAARRWFEAASGSEYRSSKRLSATSGLGE